MPQSIVFEAYRILDLVKCRVDACKTVHQVDDIFAKYSGTNLNNELSRLQEMLGRFEPEVRHSLNTIIEENRALILHFCDEKKLLLQHPGSLE